MPKQIKQAELTFRQDFLGNSRADGNYIDASPFADINTLQRLLYPEANSERPSIDTYANSLELKGRLTNPVRDAIEKAKAIKKTTHTVVYIAGGLTGVDEITKERYGQASSLLNAYSPIGKKNAFFGYVPHLHGTDPIKHPQVTPDEVRDIDFLWAVIVADHHLNFLHPLAHGNAIEAGWSEGNMIPTIQINPKYNKLSRLTLGLNNIVDKVGVNDTTLDDATVEGIKQNFDEIYTWLRFFPNFDPRLFYYSNYANIQIALEKLSGIKAHHIRNILVYVKDQTSPYYGKVGYVTCHDREYGISYVTFEGENKSLGFPDGLDGKGPFRIGKFVSEVYTEFSWWLNLNDLRSQSKR